jgi:GNAT superfamily N-acetyltransferase
MTQWVIAAEPVDQPDSAAVLRSYFTDIVGRYYGREATAAEVDTALADEPGGALEPPTGVFLLARQDGVVGGCVGVLVAGPGIGLLTKVFVLAHARRQGVAARMLEAAEDAARGMGLGVMRLEVRADLVEARALYARSGYKEVEPFSDDIYADYWFEKAL